MIPLKKILELNEAPPRPVQPKFPAGVEPVLHDPIDIRFARDEMMTDKISKAFDDYISQESQISKVKPEKLRVEALVLVIQQLYEKLTPKERHEFEQIIKSPGTLR